MKKLTAVLVGLLAIVLSASSAGISRANMLLLDSLDAVLARSDEFVASKEASLARIKSRASVVTDLEERYWLYRDLYHSYSAYDSDSALAYSARAIVIADSLGRRHWMDDALLSRAYILSATGLFQQANETIQHIDPEQLSPRMYLNYCETNLFVQTHLDQYVDARDDMMPYTSTTDELLEALCSSLPSTDPEYYWISGWRALRTQEGAREFIPRLEAVMAGAAYDSRNDARNAWMMSALYDKLSDNENRLKYLILSAMADVRASVREIASLEDVAAFTYAAGDLDHANTYISYAIRCASDYKNRVRIARLADLQYHISEAYEERNAAQAKRLDAYFAVLIVILLILTAAFTVIVAQLRRIRRRGMQLDQANEALNMRVSELHAAREQLHAANESLTALYASVKEDARELARVNDAKEKYIADIFAICSDNVDKLDEFRKKINRMIMAGRFDEVRELTKSPELSHSELKELYANFDRIFLQIYPEFIADFNSLLRPEEEIRLKKGELLNTELRIYALVRLGLNDSVKISNFLHCSVQTVYNTRLRIRNKARVPREEFAARVRSLGKAIF